MWQLGECAIMIAEEAASPELKAAAAGGEATEGDPATSSAATASSKVDLLGFEIRE